MSALSPAQQHTIQAIVGKQRARFDVRERRLYSSDTSTLPRPLRLLTRGALADGVAQPEHEDQIVSIVQFAAQHNIAVVPRARATSGYGGTVPTRGGLVLDLTRLTGVVRLDAERLTVTVRAGTVWSDLERALEEHRLRLRLYPTSAPGSTVGGWLAQGGAGIGSYQHGWFIDNVCSARIVTGSGEVKVVDGAELEAIGDAEGSTGIITEVTLRVQRASELSHVLIAWPDAQSLVRALMQLSEQKLAIWSVTFFDPVMARLKEASRRLQHPPADETPNLVEDRFSALLSFETTHGESVCGELSKIAAETGGDALPDAVAQLEWDERFRPMRVKRLGPSVIPIEVVVPLQRLEPALRDLQCQIHGPLALEGLSVRGNEVVLLGLIPHDERSISYTFGYAAALAAIRIAERHGGRAYSTGRWLAARADRILGPARVRALAAARQRNDPRGILNPGKVLDGSRAVGLALMVEPLARAVARVAGQPRPPAERLAPRRGFPADVATYAYACTQCAYCVDVCPQFQDDGWESSSPRGKWSFLKSVLERRDRFDIQMTDVFEQCSSCGKCDTACQLELPILSTWGSLRRTLWQGMLTRTS